MWKVGDQVWVKTGISSSHEELATITKLPQTNDDSPAKKKSKKSTTKAIANGTDINKEGDVQKEIVVKYTVAGYEATVSTNKIRHMESLDINDNNMDGRGRKVRRSGRSSTNNTSVLMNTGSAADIISGSGIAATATTATKNKFKKNAASAITPSPTSTELDTNNSSGSDDVTMEDTKPAAAASKKRKNTSVKDGASNKKKVKSNGEKKKGSSPYFAKDDKTDTAAAKGKKKASKGRKLMLASSEEDDEQMTKEERWVKNEQARRKTNNKGGAIAERERAFGKDGKRRVRMAEAAAAAAKKSTAVAKGGKTKEEPESRKGRTQSAAAAALSYADSFCVPCQDDEEPAPETKKKASRKKKAAKGGSTSSASSNNNDNNNAPAPQEGNQPDGNGALNQPTMPWIVEYSKTGRATCRSCDEKILKGEVRVGHTPLFRGKPGFMVYRHLHCATFSEDIVVAEDVENYSTLNEDDYEKLVQQVEISKERIIEERKELRPDELVQKNFTGEIRSEPSGLVATLLPFQVEGFSWMRHQEVMEPEIRGGILADEMGKWFILVVFYAHASPSKLTLSFTSLLFNRHGKDTPDNRHDT